MTTEVKPPSAVRRFVRMQKKCVRDKTDLMIMTQEDGCFYYNKIHHNNRVEDWELLDMMLVIKQGNWKEL